LDRREHGGSMKSSLERTLELMPPDDQFGAAAEYGAVCIGRYGDKELWATVSLNENELRDFLIDEAELAGMCFFRGRCFVSIWVAEIQLVSVWIANDQEPVSPPPFPYIHSLALKLGAGLVHRPLDLGAELIQRHIDIERNEHQGPCPPWPATVKRR
jgi:hypothetical protein